MSAAQNPVQDQLHDRVHHHASDRMSGRRNERMTERAPNRPLEGLHESDLRACRELMRTGSKSFFMSSLVLPERVRAPASALYAYCRVADDAIDTSDDAAAALRVLQRRLDAVYAGIPEDDLIDRALSAVVTHAALPRSVFDALLEGFAWDAGGRRYETIEALHDYGARVAGTVGAMMALVMETRDARSVARAAELGVAMQLTNIARDVGEDARNGRLYLPLAWMREAGLDPEAWLAHPSFDTRIASVVKRLLDEADRLYARAECGVRGLPRDCRPAIQAARLVYADIGHALAREGLDSVGHRTVVGPRRKLALLLRATTAMLVAPGHPMDLSDDAGEPIAAVRFLVQACADGRLARRTFYQRSVRVLDIFERHSLGQAG
jgi:15-cis-phytoene synthase